MVKSDQISIQTRGDGDIVDITEAIAGKIQAAGTKSGIVAAFVPGSTAALTTIEYEPGLLTDLPDLFEKIVPSNVPYQHDKTWHDGNGFSHLRAALVGPDVTIPFVEGHLQLGTWQQVVFLEFDNRPRDRKVILQIIGE
jgi:secondary thiamine-phosphate synthase enzyme